MDADFDEDADLQQLLMTDQDDCYMEAGDDDDNYDYDVESIEDQDDNDGFEFCADEDNGDEGNNEEGANNEAERAYNADLDKIEIIKIFNRRRTSPSSDNSAISTIVPPPLPLLKFDSFMDRDWSRVTIFDGNSIPTLHRSLPDLLMSAPSESLKVPNANSSSNRGNKYNDRSDSNRLHNPIMSKLLSRWFTCRSKRENLFKLRKLSDYQQQLILGQQTMNTNVDNDENEKAFLDSLADNYQLMNVVVYKHNWKPRPSTAFMHDNSTNKDHCSYQRSDQYQPQGLVLPKLAGSDTDVCNVPASSYSNGNGNGNGTPSPGPGIIAAVHVKDSNLIFDSCFESGNLQSAHRIYNRDRLMDYKPLNPIPSIGTNYHYIEPNPVDQEYDLILRNDLFTEGNIQWYYFAVSPINHFKSGVVTPLVIRFNLVNMKKNDSLYSYGMKPVIRVSESGEDNNGANGWHHGGYDICYYKNYVRNYSRVRQQQQQQQQQKARKKTGFSNDKAGSTSSKKSGKGAGANTNTTTNNSKHRNQRQRHRHRYILSFSYTFTGPDTVYFAHSFPYTYTDLEKYMSQLENNPRVGSFLHRRLLSWTIAGHRCDILTITTRQYANANNNSNNNSDITSMNTSTATAGSSSSTLPAVNSVPPTESDNINPVNKPIIVITGRVHPGEPMSSYIIHGIINTLTADTPLAQALRDQYVFKIVPMLNPDGVIHGNYRCSLAGVDLNRRYLDPHPSLNPTIHALKKYLQQLQTTRQQPQAPQRPILMFLDIHGHSKKKNVFVYGCDLLYQPPQLLQLSSQQQRGQGNITTSASNCDLTSSLNLENTTDNDRKTVSESDHSNFNYMNCTGPEAHLIHQDDFFHRRVYSRIFPRLLSTSPTSTGTDDDSNTNKDTSQGCFSYRDCHFKISKSKLGAGRVVCWHSLHIDASYTIEASFCGNGNNQEAKILKALFTRENKSNNNNTNNNNANNRFFKYLTPEEKERVKRNNNINNTATVALPQLAASLSTCSYTSCSPSPSPSPQAMSLSTLGSISPPRSAGSLFNRDYGHEETHAGTQGDHNYHSNSSSYHSYGSSRTLLVGSPGIAFRPARRNMMNVDNGNTRDNNNKVDSNSDICSSSTNARASSLNNSLRESSADDPVDEYNETIANLVGSYRSSYHYSQRDYLDMGTHICHSLADFLNINRGNMNPTSTSSSISPSTSTSTLSEVPGHDKQKSEVDYLRRVLDKHELPSVLIDKLRELRSSWQDDTIATLNQRTVQGHSDNSNVDTHRNGNGDFDSHNSSLWLSPASLSPLRNPWSALPVTTSSSLLAAELDINSDNNYSDEMNANQLKPTLSSPTLLSSSALSGSASGSSLMLLRRFALLSVDDISLPIKSATIFSANTLSYLAHLADNINILQRNDAGDGADDGAGIVVDLAMISRRAMIEAEIRAELANEQAASTAASNGINKGKPRRRRRSYYANDDDDEEEEAEYDEGDDVDDTGDNDVDDVEVDEGEAGSDSEPSVDNAMGSRLCADPRGAQATSGSYLLSLLRRIDGNIAKYKKYRSGQGRSKTKQSKKMVSTKGSSDLTVKHRSSETATKKTAANFLVSANIKASPLVAPKSKLQLQLQPRLQPSSTQLQQASAAGVPTPCVPANRQAYEFRERSKSQSGRAATYLAPSTSSDNIDIESLSHLVDNTASAGRYPHHHGTAAVRIRSTAANANANANANAAAMAADNDCYNDNSAASQHYFYSKANPSTLMTESSSRVRPASSTNAASGCSASTSPLSSMSSSPVSSKTAMASRSDQSATGRPSSSTASSLAVYRRSSGTSSSSWSSLSSSSPSQSSAGSSLSLSRPSTAIGSSRRHLAGLELSAEARATCYGDEIILPLRNGSNYNNNNNNSNMSSILLANRQLRTSAMSSQRGERGDNYTVAAHYNATSTSNSNSNSISVKKHSGNINNDNDKLSAPLLGTLSIRKIANPKDATLL